MSKKKYKHGKAKTTEGRKRTFAYKPLGDKFYQGKKAKDIPLIDVERNSEASKWFQSIRWDLKWQEFLELDSDGRYKHQTIGQLVRASTKEKKEQEWMRQAIDTPNKNAKRQVPFVGDWATTRSSLFIGEVNKETLLFGSPRIAAVKEMVKNHLDVMGVSKAIGELMMEWLGRYHMLADQVDKQFQYSLFDHKADEKKNEARWRKYTSMLEYFFNRQIDAAKQILKCFGVGENDVALLTQMMISACRAKLGDSTANMMIAASAGIKTLPGSNGYNPEIVDRDQETIRDNATLFETNPVMKQIMGTFVAKSALYRMPTPGVTIDGVQDEGDMVKTDPPKKAVTNGKANGKHAEKLN